MPNINQNNEIESIKKMQEALKDIFKSLKY